MSKNGRRLRARPQFKHLVVNPVVSFFHAVAQPDIRFPAEIFFDERVVTVEAIHSLGAFKLYARLSFTSAISTTISTS